MRIATVLWLFVFPPVGIIMLVNDLDSSRQDRREETRRRMDMVQARRELRMVRRTADELERAVRAEYLSAVVHGDRCRGCGTIARNVEAVEGQDGKAVKLCPSCRKLLGAEEI